MLIIYKSNDDLLNKFDIEKSRINKILGDNIIIEHVGSTAVPNVDGKGIIDILIGFDTRKQMEDAVKKLSKQGYFPGRDDLSKANRLFMASTQDDTTIGDVHLHLALKKTEEFINFLIVRDYLCHNPKIAQQYSEMKHKIAREVNFDREEYKKRKSEFVADILSKVREND